MRKDAPPETEERWIKSWTPAMESACRVYLDVVDTSLRLLDAKQISVRDLRAALEEVAVATETFDKAVADVVFGPRPKEAISR